MTNKKDLLQEVVLAAKQSNKTLNPSYVESALETHDKKLLTQLLEVVEGKRKVHTKDCGRCNNCEVHVSSCEDYIEMKGGNRMVDDIKQEITKLMDKK